MNKSLSSKTDPLDAYDDYISKLEQQIRDGKHPSSARKALDPRLMKSTNLLALTHKTALPGLKWWVARMHKLHFHFSCTKSSKTSFTVIFPRFLTPADKMTNLLSTLISPKVAEFRKAKSAKRSFASKYLEFHFWHEASLRSFSLPKLSHFWWN